MFGDECNDMKRERKKGGEGEREREREEAIIEHSSSAISRRAGNCGGEI